MDSWELSMDNRIYFCFLFLVADTFCQGSDYVYATVVIVTETGTWRLSRKLALGSPLKKRPRNVVCAIKEMISGCASAPGSGLSRPL